MHDPGDLIHLFNTCFADAYHTRLVRGEDEPVYLPKDDQCAHHRIVFAHGFFSSALHECAHWLIAGEARRNQEDYGYWYVPDGRDAAQQRLFEHVEVKPQALEWLLSRAAKYRFQFSLDNLSGAPADIDAFQQKVYRQAQAYVYQGLPKRARTFHAALLGHYKMLKIPQPPVCDRFGREWVFFEELASNLLGDRQKCLVTL